MTARGAAAWLQDNMRALVYDRRVVSGVSVACGDAARAYTDRLGNAREVLLAGGAFMPAVQPLVEDSIFDLASVTKLFTAISILQLRNAGALRLDDPLTKFAPRFLALPETSVGALLSFRAPIVTDGRVDAAADRAEAEARLFSARPAPTQPARYYTDMGAMALKYVIEAAAGQPYYAYLRENVLLPLGMTETYAHVPTEKLARTVCCNYERRKVNGEYRVDTDCPAGVPHDPKARVLMRGTDDLTGHAGLFSTLGDMVRLAQGLLRGTVLPVDALREMGVNRTGYRLPDGGYTQYLGYLCYAKHPQQTYSEVPACFSDGTVALNGYTGNHFSVDPAQGRFMVILANRVHDRITVLTGRPDPNDPTVTARWNDGRVYPVSQNYTYLKDAMLKEPMAALLDEGGFGAAENGGKDGKDRPQPQ